MKCDQQQFLRQVRKPPQGFLTRTRGVLLATVLIPFLLACSIAPSSTPSNFYLLDAVASAPVETQSATLRLGIGPVEMPGYLDRPQIVTRVSTKELTLAEFDRWAEPLDQMFSRSLILNLKALLGSEHLYPYPWPRDQQLDYRITVRVLAFENNSTGDATLSVHWQLFSTDRSAQAKSFYVDFAAPAADESYPARIAALNATLAQLAGHITQHLDSN